MSRLRSRWTPYLMAALVTLSPLALAQGGWIDKKTGQAVPDTEQAKSVGGFSASLLVTTDPDWQAKWETSPDTIPSFSTAGEIAKGEALFILTFLANPKLDKAGMTDVSCDFVLSKPDGSRVFNEMDLPCFKTRLTSEPTLVYLSPATMKFVAEAEDPSGKWDVAITVKDQLRGVSIPLRTSFSVR